jgi:Ca-activated chloride channel homolog
MTLLWPWALVALLLVPLVVLWYRRARQARAAQRKRLAEQGVVLSDPPRLRLSHSFYLVALVLLLAALARPEASVPQPQRAGTIVLAFDVSASMAAPDATPTRLDVAKTAAKTVVEHEPPEVRISVVAFGGTGVVAQEPTADHVAVVAAIDRLRPQGATSLGRGLQAALSAVTGSPVLVDTSESADTQGQDLGFHGSAAVVLLTDGENTGDPDPLDVADVASGAGIRVFPVGLGSTAGSVLSIDGFQVATALDEQLLQAIAQRTDGRYLAADDPQLASSLADAVDLTWEVKAQRIELTALVAAAAVLFLVAGAALALARSGRVA